MPALENAFKFDTYRICLFLGKDDADRTVERKVRCHHFLIELFRQEAEVVLGGLMPTRRVHGRRRKAQRLIEESEEHVAVGVASPPLRGET